MALVRPSAMGPLLLSLLLVGGAPGALASTFTFGATDFREDLSTVSLTGDAEDRDWGEFSMSTAASANFRAQASADILSDETAIADVTLFWDVPYTLTRNVTVENGTASYPLQTVAFTITFSGAVAVSQFGGDENAQIFDGISVSSVGSLFPAVSFNGAIRSNSDGSTPVSGADIDGYDTTVNFSGPSAGEVTVSVPIDFRAWDDYVSPFALDYSQQQIVVQSFSDTLRVSYRLRAVSDDDGGFPGTAGEAMACAGLLSGLDPFDLNDTTNCGDGLTILGAVGIFDTEVLPVPEPGTLLLAALGLGGLAAYRRRS